MPTRRERVRKKRFETMFSSSDEEVAKILATKIDEIRVLISGTYHEITRLTLKAKVCQLIFASHLNRFTLQDYLLALIKESKKCDKEVWLGK